VSDETPYFQALTITDLGARDDLAFVTLPAYSPELNSVEECWTTPRRSDQQILPLARWLQYGDRYFSRSAISSKNE